jgi:hypothetical protein
MNNYCYDITKHGFEVDSNDEDEFIKIISRFKNSKELFEYYTAYHNMADCWVIEHIIDRNPAIDNYDPKNARDDMVSKTTIYYGIIPDDDFGDKLFNNIMYYDPFKK